MHSQDHAVRIDRGAARSQTCTVLLAEADPECRLVFGRALRDEGYRVVDAEDSAEVLRCFASSLMTLGTLGGFDVIVSEASMPGLSGLQVLSALRELSSTLPVIVMTPPGDQASHNQAERLGAAAVLERPFGIDALRATVSEVINPHVARVA